MKRIRRHHFDGIMWNDASYERGLAILAAKRTKDQKRLVSLNSYIDDFDKTIAAAKEFGWRHIDSPSNSKRLHTMCVLSNTCSPTCQTMTADFAVK